MAADPSIPVLRALLTDGCARVPEAWGLVGPGRAGLWWRDGGTVVATPAFVRLAASLAVEGEAIAALLATDSRYRQSWLDLIAARLADLGRRGATTDLFSGIERLGPAARVIRPRLEHARLAPTPFTAVELATLGAPADQPAAVPALLRVIGATAALVEADQGQRAPSLPPVHSADPSLNWVPGRLLQAPDARPDSSDGFVLSGAISPIGEARMRAVLATPWLTLLAVLVFTAEAWAAERHGGVVLELPAGHLAEFAAPPRVEVVVTLDDGREVLCGSLGELCVRVVDALGMAIVPAGPVAEIDAALAPVIASLLRAGAWTWQALARPRYVISDAFSVDCYRGEGHRYINRAGDALSQAIRSVCVAWGRTRLEREA